MKNPIDFEQCAQRLKILSDPNRLQLIGLLFNGESTVTKLATESGQGVSMASHHLVAMLNADILIRRKDGRFVYYALHPGLLTCNGGAARRQLNIGCCMVKFDPEPPVQIGDGARLAGQDGHVGL